MPGDIGLLHRLAAGIETEEDRAAFAERVRLYLDGAPDGLSLDAAFGLGLGPGEEPWWRRDARFRRDAALRDCADRFHAGLPMAVQAARIRTALNRYATTAWRFDRTKASLPAQYVGTELETFWDMLRAVDAVLSAEHIRRILRER